MDNRQSRREIASYLRRLKKAGGPVSNDNGKKYTEADVAAMEKRVLDTASAVAKMRKRMFDEYIAAGFSEEQALQLCTK